MSGAIKTNILLNPIDGGVVGQPGPVLLVWTSGSGSEGISPINNNFSVGLWENALAGAKFKPFNRIIAAPHLGSGIIYKAWHRDQIWEHTSPSWTSVLTITDIFVSGDIFYHTGLNVVMGSDGVLYLCGLYSRTGGDIGFVKQNLKTGTYSFGPVGGDNAAGFLSPWGKSVVWKDKLICLSANAVVVYDPATDRVQRIQIAGGLDIRSRFAITKGRLFLAGIFGSDAAIFEYLDLGGFVRHAGFLGGAPSSSANGNWLVLDGHENSRFYVFYYRNDVGGSGWRVDKVVPGSDVQGALDVTLTDLTDPVMPTSDPIIGDLRYPAGLSANANQRWEWAPDGTEWPRGAFGTSGGVFGALHLADTGAATEKNVQWQGETLPLTSASPTGTAAYTFLVAWPNSRWGTNEFDSGNPSTIIVFEASFYSDSVVSRGILLKFLARQEAPGAPNVDLQLLYDGTPGEDVHAGAVNGPATLSVGNGLDLGGTATLDPVEKSLKNITRCSASTDAGRGAILSHNSPVGTGFIVGEGVTGGTSGASGTIVAVLGSQNRLGIHYGSGTAFVNGETITGTLTGTVATLVADPDTEPVYQVIWDLDADGIPGGKTVIVRPVTIQAGGTRPPAPGNTGTYGGGPAFFLTTSQFQSSAPPTTTQTHQAQPSALTTGAPSTTQSAQAQPTVVSSGAPNTTQSSQGQPSIVSSGASKTTQSPQGQPPVSQILETLVVGKTSAPYVGPGSLEIQVGGASVQVVGRVGRDGLNFQPEGLGSAVRGEPALPAGPKIIYEPDGPVALGSVDIDAVGSPAGTTFLIGTLSGADPGVLVELEIAALNVQGVTTPPQINVGTASPWTDQAAAHSVGLTQTDTAERPALAAIRQRIPAGGSLTVELAQQAVATAFSIRVTAFVLRQK